MAGDDLQVQFSEDSLNGEGTFIQFSGPFGGAGPVTPPDVFWINTETVVLEGQLARLGFRIAQAHLTDIRVTLGLYAETPGSGILVPGVDFTWDAANLPTYVIPAGQVNGAFAVQVTQDATKEPEETHRFVITGAIEVAPQPGFVSGTEQRCAIRSPTDTTLRVLESSPAVTEAQLSTTGLALREGTLASFDVVLTTSHGSSIDVTLSQISGGDLSDRLSVSPVVVTFAAGETTQTVTVTGIDNGLEDSPETGEWQITAVDAPYVAGSLDTIAIVIHDPPAPPPLGPDPPPAILWTNPPSNAVEVLEGELAVMRFQMEYSHTAAVRVTLGLFAETPGVGILEPGIDFTWDQVNPPTFVIPAGRSGGEFLVQTIQDADVEPTETHRFVFAEAVEIEPQPGFAEGTEQNLPILTPSSTTLRVFDQSPAVQDVQLSTPSLGLREGDRTLFNVRLSQSHTSAVSVTLSQISGGDLSGRLTVSPETVVFAPGETTKPVAVIGIDNGQNESAETGEWQITSAGSPYVVGALDTIAIEISDPPPEDEPIYKWWTDVIQMGEWGNPSGLPFQTNVTVVITNPDDVDLTVSRSVRPNQIGGAAIDPADYSWPQGDSFGFGYGNASSTKLLEISMDTEPEAIETALLEIDIITGGGSVSSTDGTLEVQIHSFEASASGSDLQIQFLYPSAVHDSDDPATVQMWVTMSRAFTEPVVVQMGHYSPNAVDHTDYERFPGGAMPNFVLFAPGVTEVSVQFEILPAGTATSLKWVVSELTGTSHGQIWMCSRHLTVMQGDTDVRKCVPDEPPLPSPIDFELYEDRVEPSSARAIAMFGSGVSWPVVPPLGGYANSPYRVVSPYLYQLWLQENPAGSRWMDSGNIIVLGVMENIQSRMRINSHTPALQFVSGSGAAAFNVPIRDIWFEGVDQGGGVKPIIGSVVWYGNRGSDILPLDNFHFRGLEVREAYEGQEKHTFKGIGPHVGWPALHHGMFRINNCLLRDRDEGVGGPGEPAHGSGTTGHGKSGLRSSHHMNYWITDCEFGVFFEHGFYSSQIAGLAILARNTLPRGTGRSFFQVVQRPLEVTGIMGHGMLAIVGNLDNDIGDPQASDTGAKCFSIYGFWGDVLMYDNTHTGRLQRVSSDPWFKSSNRGGPAVLVQYQDNSGFYVAEWPPFSGEFYCVKRLRIENDVFTCSSSSDILASSRLQFRGVYDLQIGGFSTSIPTQSSNGYSELVIFNHRVEINRGNTMVDQLGREVSQRVGQFLPNRHGGVSWMGAASTPLAGPIDGQLLSYVDVLNSRPKYTAGVAAFNYDRQMERDFDSQGNSPDVNSYDGSDPA